MQKTYPITFRRGDWFAIALVLLMAIASLVAFFPRGDVSAASIVQIRLDGRLIEELPIGTDRETAVSGNYTNVICIRDGKVAIIGSDCPGTDCVHSGWIDSPGRSIVCLPNRLEIRIAGGSSDVDFVVR